MPRRTRKQLASLVRFFTWRGVLATVVCVFIAVGVTRLALHKAFFGETIQHFLASKQSLTQQVVVLQEKLDSVSADEAQLSLLRDENATLKAELGRTDHEKGILASVLFPPGRSLYDTFVVDAGSAEGIREGMSVDAFDSIVLGTITSVEEHRATVTLLSAAGKETPATSIPDSTAVTLIGRGAGEYEIHMPRDIHFDKGQVIVAQSTRAQIIARIVEITADARDPFQKIRAKVPINLQTLRWVIVK